MTRNISYLLWILAPLWMSCSFMNDGIECDEGMPTDSIHISISFDLAGTEGATRAVPNGGEEGDGWQYGLTNENQLHNFIVFVLGDNNDANSPGSTAFIGSRYFSDEEVAEVDSIRQYYLKLKAYDVLKDVLTYDFTIPIHHYKPREVLKESFRFLVVANNGNLTAFETLGQLREAIPEVTWRVGSDGKVERFVMANENDQYYSTTLGVGAGSEENPIRIHVTIERMAARIDYNPEGATLVQEEGKVNKTIVYTITDNETTTLAQLYIDKMAIVNACQKPSYYIKRVADDINGTNLVYLGDETPTPRGIATNVVIDPYSTQKTVANTTNETLLTTLYGDTRMGNVEQLLQSTAEPALTAVNQSVILGYVNENTYAPAMAHSAYTTGVVFKCRFVPKHNFHTAYDKATGTLTDGTYTVGQDFWMVEPSQDTETKVETTVDEVTEEEVTTTTTTDRSYTSISEADRHYFSNEAAAIDYATDTRHKHYGRVVKYTGGVCYYFAYMRHSNNVEVIHNTMEFGIVRNNIYTFKLQPTTGPGTPTIDPRHPEELKARIYVRKWLLVEHPTILMS
ncbi:MAG: Mfa1 fimbrilin C-terminal domain-containing protein [Prevotella sp.]|nr:Mfa1 fimbrilin C-terminal domain-containing protein [Prevotella sp.]